MKNFASPEVRVVEASAGSGKTYALSKRYVQLALSTVSAEKLPIRNILALTFTNKAAFEMKARILEFLKRIAFKKISEAEIKDILEPLGLNLEQGSLHAFAVMEGIIHQYNFFQVQTIDKFINALLSGCAFKIGLTANFTIKTNAYDYLQYSLDQLIDRAHYETEVFQVFEEFLHNYLYLENRTGWFPKEDILNIINTLFHQNNAYGYEIRESGFEAVEIVKNKKKILANIKALESILPEKTNAAFVKSLKKFLTNNLNSFDMDSVSDYFAREEFPVRKGGDVSDEVEQLWMLIRTGLRQLCLQEAYSLFNAYIHIFKKVMEGFQAISAKDDCLFLGELNKKARMLFDDDGITVEELYYRLATRFKHYLVDEFQDTSRLQWHNLEKMVEEALSTGGTLFYVGDQKQAIYGFRGGDAGLFDDVKQEFKPFNVCIDRLEQNWRSQKAVVEFNNSIFSIENLQRFIRQKEFHELDKKKKNRVIFSDKDLRKIENVFGGAKQAFQKQKDGGYVKIEYIDIANKEERDDFIRWSLIDCIKDLQQRFSLGDIAILTRGNNDIERITNWLLEEGISVASERTSNIQENFLIKELMAFLRFLDSPIDNLAFTTFILGDIFSKASGLTLEELHSFVFGLREKLRKEKDVYIYIEFRKQYADIWENFINEFFRNVGLYPLYELAVSIYSKFQCLPNFSEYQGFLMHFLELIKKQEEEHSDITSFLEYFEKLQGEDLYVHVTDSDAVKILTIHKSKGLEFPVVILPFLGMDIKVGSGDNQQSYCMQRQELTTELVRLKAKYLKFSEELYQVHAREYKEALLSELNNIYVALTRPEKELYAFIPKKVGGSFNVLKFLIPEECYEQGQKSIEEGKEEKEDGKSKATSFLPLAQYQDWIGYLNEEFCQYDQFKNKEQRLRGEVLHYILSLINDLTGRDVQVDVNESIVKAQAHFLEVEDWQGYEKDILVFLEREDVKSFFYCEEAEIFTEKEVINKYGHVKRIDRLMVMDKDVWIVDYKTGQEVDDERNEKQIREYEEIIKEMYPKKEVKGFLVSL